MLTVTSGVLFFSKRAVGAGVLSGNLVMRTTISKGLVQIKWLSLNAHIFFFTGFLKVKKSRSLVEDAALQ